MYITFVGQCLSSNALTVVSLLFVSLYHIINGNTQLTLALEGAVVGAHFMGAIRTRYLDGCS